MNNFDVPYTFYTLLNKDNPLINGLLLPVVGDSFKDSCKGVLSNSLINHILDSFSDLISLFDVSGNFDSKLFEKFFKEENEVFKVQVEDIIHTNSDQSDFITLIFDYHFKLSNFLNSYKKSFLAIVTNDTYDFLDDNPICEYIKDNLKLVEKNIHKIIDFNSFISSVLKSLEEVKK